MCMLLCRLVDTSVSGGLDMSQATAVLEKDAARTTCRKCKSVIVLTRNSDAVKTFSMCPKCGAGIRHIWLGGKEVSH